MQGLSVCVFERKLGIIDKACGEGLMPHGMEQLNRLGIHLERVHPFRGIRYIQGKSPSIVAQGHFKRGVGYGVRRVELSRAMLKRAEALGVDWRYESARDVTVLADGVSVNGVDGRYLLAADGLNSSLSRQFGMRLKHQRTPRYGMRQHFSTPPWTDHVEVYWCEDGEAYVTPVDANTVGVAFLFNKPKQFDTLLDGLPDLKNRLGEPASELRGAGPFYQRTHRRVHGRLLLIGDAAGYVDPLTGEGLSVGFKTATLAVDSIARNRPADYERAWGAAMRRYNLMTHGLLWLTQRRWIRRHLVRILRRLPWLFNMSLRLLGGASSREQLMEGTNHHGV